MLQSLARIALISVQTVLLIVLRIYPGKLIQSLLGIHQSCHRTCCPMMQEKSLLLSCFGSKCLADSAENLVQETDSIFAQNTLILSQDMLSCDVGEKPITVLLWFKLSCQ